MDGETAITPLLSREQILAQKGKLLVRDVPVPEWGGTVRIRELTSKERVQVEMSMVRQSKGSGGAQANLDSYPMLRGRVLARTIVNDALRPLFTEADIADLTELAAGPIERLFEIACAMSGLSQQDVDTMVGEFVTTPNGGSSSA